MKRETIHEELDRRMQSVDDFNRFYTGRGLSFIVKKSLKFGFPYIKYLFSRFFRFNTVIRCPVFWGDQISMRLRDPETLPVLLFGTLSGDEWKLMKFFLNYIKNTDVVYDIGANYGFYSLLAKKMHARKVFSFEPNADILPSLHKNIGKRARMKVVEKAIAEKTGSVDFYLQKNGSANSTMNKDVIKYRSQNFSRKKLEAISLDDFIQSNAIPTIIKIDIEGSELYALRGAEKLLRIHKPVISLEVWAEEKGRIFSLPAVNFLQSFGYKSFDITSRGLIVEMDQIAFEALDSSMARNVIFIHESKTESFLRRH